MAKSRGLPASGLSRRLWQAGLPAFLKKYFWDVDIRTVNLKKHKRYIIERLLEYGDERAIQFLRRAYNVNDIREVLRKTRRLSLRSAYFWASILGVSSRSLACLKKRHLKIRAGHWIE